MSLAAGHGRIVARIHGQRVVFEELSSAYPMKLLAPMAADDAVAVAYIMNYGGGLVGGDAVHLKVDCGTGTTLVLLSQGSTKVFKARLRGRSAGTKSITNLTRPTTQTADVVVDGALFLLPDPVTCFRGSSYNQIQRFHLSSNASILILDWLTSGRKSLNEEWVFTRYFSLNEVFVAGKRVAKDVLLLDDTPLDVGPTLPPRTLRERLSPYSAYCTLILLGPMVQNIIRDMESEYERISVFKTHTPEDLLWSLSPIKGGAIVRLAGKETESLKQWLGKALHGVEGLIGTDVYRRAFM